MMVTESPVQPNTYDPGARPIVAKVLLFHVSVPVTGSPSVYPVPIHNSGPPNSTFMEVDAVDESAGNTVAVEVPKFAGAVKIL